MARNDISRVHVLLLRNY